MDIDEKKMDCFNHGLSCILQEKLYTWGYQTFGALMNAAIDMEGLQRDSQAEWKHKQVITGSFSHPQAHKVQVSRRVPYQSSGGQSFRQP